MPKVAAWVDALLARPARARSATRRGTADPRFSPHGVLAFTDRERWPADDVPDDVRFVGPSIARASGPADFPWDVAGRAAPTVLVTLGTANADAGAVPGACGRGVRGAGRPVQAVVVDPAGVLARVPPNRRWCAARSAAGVAVAGGRRGLPRRPQHGVRDAVARRAAGASRRSATTSRSSPTRSSTRARACGCGSTGSTPSRLGAAVDTVLDPATGTARQPRRSAGRSPRPAARHARPTTWSE